VIPLFVALYKQLEPFSGLVDGPRVPRPGLLVPPPPSCPISGVKILSGVGGPIFLLNKLKMAISERKTPVFLTPPKMGNQNPLKVDNTQISHEIVTA
jgi:hypothetical protein